jgi:hypothetical protein
MGCEGCGSATWGSRSTCFCSRAASSAGTLRPCCPRPSCKARAPTSRCPAPHSALGFLMRLLSGRGLPPAMLKVDVNGANAPELWRHLAEAKRTMGLPEVQENHEKFLIGPGPGSPGHGRGPRPVCCARDKFHTPSPTSNRMVCGSTSENLRESRNIWENAFLVDCWWGPRMRTRKPLRIVLADGGGGQ